MPGPGLAGPSGASSHIWRADQAGGRSAPRARAAHNEMGAGVATSPHCLRFDHHRRVARLSEPVTWFPHEAEASAVPDRSLLEASFDSLPASHCPCPGGLPPKGAGPAEWLLKSRRTSAFAYAGAASPPPCLRFPGPFPFGNDAVPRRPVAESDFGPFPARPLPGYGLEAVMIPDSLKAESACG